jgi:hypothetical protein
MARFDSAYVSLGLGGSIRTNLASIARLLLARAIASGDVRGTVEAFRSYVEKNSASTIAVMAVSAAVKIEREVRLGADIRLVPLRSLSPSMQRGAALGQAYFPSFPHEGISCALYTPLEFKPVFFWPPEGVAPRQLRGMQARVREALDDLNEARTLLTLLGIKSASIMSWVQPRDPLMATGISTGFGIEGGHSLGIDYPPNTMAIEVLEDLAAHYFQIDRTHRHTRLRIPLDRLDRSTREFDLVDRSIDLGIALEALLLHDEGDRGDLKFRLSLRGAWLGGNNAKERAETHDTLGKVYKLRSDAVHTGKIKQTEVNEETIERATALCRQLMHKMIEAGGHIDNWNERLLGGR